MKSSSASFQVVRFGVFEVDLRAGELRKHGVKIKLQEQPLQLLAMLLERPGQVVTREEIRQKLWPNDAFVDFDHGLNNAVNRLRDALGDGADAPRFVETLPRRGYRFVAPVDGGTSHAESDPVVTPSRLKGVPLRITKRSIFYLVIAITLTLVVGLVGLRQKLRKTASTRIHAIAVLPFDNLTGDPGQDYFVDGITDSLTTELAQIKALSVTSRTSAIRYKDHKKSLPQIAKELNVDAVLEGGVRRVGDRVWITPQLIEAASDQHLWAKSYERSLSEMQTFQKQVAQDIIREMRVEFTSGEKAGLAPARPVNAEAYDVYLQGRYFWNKRTTEGLNKSIGFFEQALQKDPKYALAYSGLAQSYALRPAGVWKILPAKEANEKVRQYALKALELDDSIAEAHDALGWIKYQGDRDSAGAESEFQLAIQLNPSDSTAYLWYSRLLSAEGKKDSAITNARRAIQLDPVNAAIHRALGTYFLELRQYDDALVYFRKTLELDPNFPLAYGSLCRAYLAMKRYQEGVAECEEFVRLSKGNPESRLFMAYAYARAGKRTQAQQILKQVGNEQNGDDFSWFFAQIYEALGNKDEAFRWIEKAVQRRSFWVWNLNLDQKNFDPPLNSDQNFASLRSDPRFAALLKRAPAAQ